MTATKEKPAEEEKKLPTCGIIMPISEIEGCPASHWIEVLGILKDVCNDKGFEAKLVSNAEEVGVIQKRIVENIFFSDMVICDVSCKNPNVMFELGMRLAFDKPTIIIKDHLTNYNFDIGIIEHLTYQRDLRFNTIIDFKENLGNKLDATYKASKKANYTTFLKNFGKYTISNIEETPITSDKYLLKAIEELKEEIVTMKNSSKSTIVRGLKSSPVTQDYYYKAKSPNFTQTLFNDNVNKILKSNNLSIIESDIDTLYPIVAQHLKKESIFSTLSKSPEFREYVIKALYKNLNDELS